MNKFDFSIYDNSDESPSKPKQPTQKVKEKNQTAARFDFNQYDFTEEKQPSKELSSEEESAKKDKIYQRYAAAEKTPKEITNLSTREKYQYAQDLKNEREYLQSAGFTKSAISGVTLGASENVEALKPQAHELNKGFGETLGAGLPIGVAYKAASIPIKAAITHGPKILQPLRHLMQSLGTGTLYETGKQAVNAVSGNEVDLKQIPIRGAEFAFLDSLIRGGSALAKNFLKFSPSHQAQILEQRIIPKDLPKSQYDTAEEMLKLVQKENPNKQTFPGFPGGEPPQPPGASPSITKERITPPKDIGLRPTPSRQNPNLQDQVGDLFSSNRFYNTTQGGQALRNEIMNIDEDVYRGVNELYRHSRELNSNINEIHPQLVTRLRNRVSELEAIPEPSDVQKRLIKASNNVLNKLATFDETGHATGYLPINNQILIDQIQSLRQIIDYDFAHGNTKNIFRPIINDLQDAALRAAESTGQPQAAEAINEARNAYRTWVQAFDNDYIRPFRDASNQDYSKLFKSSLDLDESNMIRGILGISERGKELSNASTREIVEKHLSKYFDNPKGVNQREFNTALRELEAVITPEQAKKIKEKFADASRSLDIKATNKTPEKKQKLSQKYEGKKPEDIMGMMNSRSGIRQIREDFPKDSFDRLSKQKMRSILRGGNIEKDFTGDDLYRFLNQEKNYELFSEFLGETETEMLRKSAKEIGKAQVKSEVRKKNISSAAKKVAAYKTLEIVLGIL